MIKPNQTKPIIRQDIADRMSACQVPGNLLVMAMEQGHFHSTWPRKNSILDIPLRPVVHGGDGQDLVEEGLSFKGACIQGGQGELGTMEIVVKVVQLHLDGCLVAGEDDVQWFCRHTL